MTNWDKFIATITLASCAVLSWLLVVAIDRINDNRDRIEQIEAREITTEEPDDSD